MEETFPDALSSPVSSVAQNVEVIYNDFKDFEDDNVFNKVDEIVLDSMTEFTVKESHRKYLLEQAEDLKLSSKLEAEKSKILNKALAEHLSAKGVEFHPELDEFSVEKYHAVLECLFKLEKKKKTLKELMNKEKLQVLSMKFKAEEERNRLKKELSEKLFESGISTINAASGQPLQEKTVSKIVNQFIKTHEGVSSARYDFIIAQNFMAELKEKEDLLDDIGDGFHVLDYENLKTEVQTFSSNIDAKQEQLDKLRNRFKNESLKLEIIKDKNIQMLGVISREKARNESLSAKEEFLRSKLNTLKLTKKQHRDEFNELSAKAGILTRVPLMRNFEAVTDEILQISKEIANQEAQIVKHKTESTLMKNKIQQLVGHKSD